MKEAAAHRVLVTVLLEGPCATAGCVHMSTAVPAEASYLGSAQEELRAVGAGASVGHGQDTGASVL